MNLEDAIKNWSDSVLRILVDEEDLTDEHRQMFSHELQNRDHGMVRLTTKMLHDAGTNGYEGWNSRQLASIGIGWPAPKGWLTAMNGKEVTAEQWRRFVSLKGKKK